MSKIIIGETGNWRDPLRPQIRRLAAVILSGLGELNYNNYVCYHTTPQQTNVSSCRLKSEVQNTKYSTQQDYTTKQNVPKGVLQEKRDFRPRDTKTIRARKLLLCSIICTTYTVWLFEDFVFPNGKRGGTIYIQFFNIKTILISCSPHIAAVVSSKKGLHNKQEGETMIMAHFFSPVLRLDNFLGDHTLI